ncbi:zinc finger protein 33A-like isoform X2 [Mytilus californianus]|uniref:zinc finger protein 33A-like isoform X2 n=1 Tax=Mytilus californianus TaxID=6549 RepID=UPI0022451EAD|nr:zinc finger protein 33A-like isoform X2 [Mytilus californianus]XP_052074487.1 zinc finger protein 33A-like isoform X2 [Mytilus californianus]
MEDSFTIPSHVDDLTKCMYELQQEGTFCDAGLECKDGVIFVHKLVLMACKSPYLRNQLASENQGTRVYVSLKNYSLKTVCCLVQTLYTGQLNISQENKVNFRLLCQTIGLNKIKSAAENFIQQDQNIYEVQNINPFCAVQVAEEIIESPDKITALVASVNHGPDDNFVDSTNTVDNVEDLNYDNSDVKVGGDMVKRSQDLEGERDADKSLDLPKVRKTRSNKRRKMFHNEITQAKDNATSSNVSEILAIAKQLSEIDKAQPSKPASSCLDQTKSSLCSLCTKKIVSEEENVTDPSKTVCTECMVLFSGETNDDQEVGTEPDQTQSYNSEDCGEDGKKDSVDLEEECLKKTCEEGSPLPDFISLDEGDGGHLPWLQEHIDNGGCEIYEISDRKLRNKSQSDKGKKETGETNQERLWSCKKCEFSTGDKQEQERHRKHHSYLKRKLRMSKLCKSQKYFCDECGNEYKSEVGLQSHKKFMHPDNPLLICMLRGCKARFVEESALQKHLLRHKSHGVLKCRKCAQVFVLKGALKRHEDYCFKRLMFRCDICNKVYKAKNNLSAHISKMHCDEGKGFNHRESLKFSRNINSTTSAVDENKGASLTVEKTILETTMEELNADNVEEFVEGMNSILLTQQNEKKSIQTPDVYCCIHCEFSTADKTHYTKHRKHHAYLIRKQKNAELQSYSCDKCETEHKTTLDLKVHMEKVHSMVYKCREKGCFKYFSDQHKLNEHCLEHETQIHICRHCGASFRSIQGLSRHELTTHSAQFYKCKVKSCPSVFKYKQQLEKHILNHKNRGLLKCKKCNKKFLMKSKLTRHEDSCIRNKTANEPTQCHLCGKQFGSKSGLLVHMRKHIDGMFDCFCGKTFDSIKNLNQHKNCHNDPMHKPFCEKEVAEESEDSTDSDSDEMEDSTS